MGLDELLKAFLPLTFLAIWAIVSLLNRETRPAPRPGQGMGPRPGLPPGPRPGERPMGDPSARWGGAPQGVRGAPASAQDDVLIIRPETARPAQRGSGSSAGTRRTQRPRSTPAPAAPRRPEPRVGQRGVAGVPTVGIAPLTKPLDLARLPGVQASLDQGSMSAAPPTTAARSARAAPPIDVAGLFANRDKVREAIIMSEILQPPRALRGRRRI